MSAETASCCVSSDCTASSITSASVDDEKTDHHHHQQQQQQDSVANITDDTSHVIPVTESEDQSTDADTQHSSSCKFPNNVVAVSTDKLPAGMCVSNSLLQSKHMPYSGAGTCSYAEWNFFMINYFRNVNLRSEYLSNFGLMLF